MTFGWFNADADASVYGLICFGNTHHSRCHLNEESTVRTLATILNKLAEMSFECPGLVIHHNSDDCSLQFN